MPTALVSLRVARSKSQVQRSRCHMKVLVQRNTDTVPTIEEKLSYADGSCKQTSAKTESENPKPIHS